MEKQLWVHGFSCNSSAAARQLWGKNRAVTGGGSGGEPVLLSAWVTPGLALVPEQSPRARAVPPLTRGTCATASPQLWNNNWKKPINYGILTGESVLVGASSSAISKQGLKGSFKTGIKLQVPNFWTVLEQLIKIWLRRDQHTCGYKG